MTFPSGAVATCPVLVGRISVVAALRQALDDAEGRRQRVVLVSGEAGIGKSRLIEEAKRYAVERRFLVIEGACFPQDRNCPYAPLLEMIRTRFDSLQPEERLGLTGPFLPELYPLLPDLFPITRDVPSSPLPDPEQARRRLFEGMSHVLTGDANLQPILLVVEDLHWCDDASLDALMHIVRRIAGQPVLLAATYRADETGADLRRWLGELDRARLVQDFPLLPLSRDEVGAMLRAILDDGQVVSPSLVDSIDGLAEGNPFFVEEFLGTSAGDEVASSAARTDNVSAFDERTWPIPRSVHACIMQRVNRIGTAAQDLLRLAAVVGRRFNYTLLERLAGLDERVLVSRIKEMVAAGLVVEESPEIFTFRHALIQQAVYRELLGRERVALHRTVADYAEDVFDGNTDQHLADLAYHCFQAEVWDKALVYARRAGEQALRRYAPQIAVEQFTRSLDAAGRLATDHGDEGQELIAAMRPGLVRGRGRAHETLGNFDAARADYESAIELSHAAGDEPQEWTARIDLGLLWAGRDYAEAGRHFEAAVGLARSTDDPALVAHSLNRVGNWRVNTTEPWEALPLHREALNLFEGIGDQRGIAETLDLLGMASFLGVDLEASIAYFERAATLFRSMDDRVGLASSLAMLVVRAGYLEYDSFTGDAAGVALGLGHAEEAIAISRSINWRAGEAFALFQYGLVLGLRGEHAQALRSLHQSLHIAEEIGHIQWQAGAHTLLTSLYLDLLSTNDAKRHAEQARSLARTIGSTFWHNFSTSLLAQTHLIAGDREQADMLLSQCSEPDDGLPIRSLGRWWVNFVDVHRCLAMGRPDEALRLIDRASRPDPDKPVTRVSPHLAHLRAEALLALGLTGEAEAILTAVRDVAERKAARPHLWRVHVALGNTYRLRARPEEARREFVAARTIIQDLAANLPVGPLRDTFLQRATAQLPRSYRLTRQRIASAQSGGLTARERQVAALIAQGKSNRQIADVLVLGERTVETHVSNILVKLDVDSRQDIAGWVATHDVSGIA